MKVFEWSRRYGLSLHTARYAEDGEEQDLTEPYQGRKLYTTGNTHCLIYLDANTPEIQEIMGRSPVGYTYDHTNLCFEVTDEEWDKLPKLDIEAKEIVRVQALKNEVKIYRSIIASYEQALRDGSLCAAHGKSPSTLHDMAIEYYRAKHGLIKDLDMLAQLDG